MNIQQLSQLVCSKEKGKSEVNIAQTKEIIKIIAIIMYENPELVEKLLSYGKRKKQ